MTIDLEKTNTIEAKYQRAQTLMQGFWGRNIVPNSTVYPVWIEGSDCFWYERDINTRKNAPKPGESLMTWDKEYRLVNAKVATNTIAFDHNALATRLAAAVEQDIDENQLPITDVEMQLDSSEQVAEVRFTAFDKFWIFEPQAGTFTEAPDKVTSKDRLVSPDGKYLIFTRDYNLWLEDLTTGEERILTSDGEELFCYAVVGNGWGTETDPLSGVQARWSKDSKRVFTLQRDSRQVETLPVVEHVPQDGSVRPKLHSFRKAIKGDEHVPEYRLVSIEVMTGRIQAANYRQIPIVRNSWGFFASNLGWWGKDSRQAYFIDLERDYKTVRVVEFDTHSGATRILFEETSETHINLMLNADEFPTFIPLPETNEVVWFSERSGWAHLYLYDLNTGALKHPITVGEGLVTNVLSVDTVRREAFAQTMGRTPDRDPYYRDLVRVNIDTGELTTLASGNYDVAAQSALHLELRTFTAMWAGRRDISSARAVSHSGEFVLLTRSRADSVPVSLLLDRNGQEILEIEIGDISVLNAALSDNWRWPEPVKLQAVDSKTDIYGLVYRPSDFSTEKSYPVINHVFNTPELTMVPKGSFTNDTVFGLPYLDAAALAELGFIVVQIDGRGTPFRGKAFYDESYGWAASASNLDDHVAGIRQLAERYPYMDLNRVGIYCHMGGPGAVQGLLHYPDFYKVGVVVMSLHDSRLQAAPMWADKFEGSADLSVDHQYPEAFVDNLQGKLLLIHGMLDITCPPAITFRMVEALQKANKDFDLLMLPNVGHTKNSYSIRRSWDYFVKHLQVAEPPKEFKLITARDLS